MNEINSVHVTLHYTTRPKRARVDIYRNDCIIFPCFNESDMPQHMQYIRQIIDNQRDITIYVERISETGRKDRHGLSILHNKKCRMFRKVADGVIESKLWGGEMFDYDTRLMTVKNAIKELEQEIILHVNWHEFACETDSQDLDIIHRHISEASAAWHNISQETQDKIIRLHSEHYSLAHCLRWGETAVTEARKELF